jgi:hypothetical protein
MNKRNTSFNRVKKHLEVRGCDCPAGAELCDDLEVVARRCDELRDLSREYGSVELSPYMRSLLRVSGVLPQCAPVARAAAVAGI